MPEITEHSWWSPRQFIEGETAYELTFSDQDGMVEIALPVLESMLETMGWTRQLPDHDTRVRQLLMGQEP